MGIQNQWMKDMEERFISWRRMFHRTPEVGWTEYVTTANIVRELEGKGFQLFIGKDAVDSESRMGVPSEDELALAEKRAREAHIPSELLKKMQGGHTGVVAILDTGRPGPHTMLRFDIDALPVTEADKQEHFPTKEGFQSSIDGQMHACAHDGHTTIGLGTAHYLSTFQDELTGKFTLLFQPAEEGSRGAAAMIAKGWFNEDVDYFLSGHIGINDSEVGQIAATTTNFLATTKFDITYHGVASHAGAKPEEGKNAMAAAVNCIQQLYSIPRHSEGATRLNVGTVTAGSGRNVIPDYAYMQGETRGETDRLNTYMFTEVDRIAHGTAQVTDTEVDVQVVGEGIAAECNTEWIEKVSALEQESDYVHRVIPTASLGASEDATQLIKKTQEIGGIATYMLFGTPLPAGHHHPQFDFGEQVLAVGVSAYTGLIRQLHREG